MPTIPASRRADAHVGQFWAPLGELAVNGRDPCRLLKRLRPLAEGVHFRDKVRDLEAWSTSRQPMLQVSQDTHRRLSSEVEQGRLRIRRCDRRHNPL
jgi:hypothetical protein